MSSPDPRQPDQPTTSRPGTPRPAEVPAPKLWPVGSDWPDEADREAVAEQPVQGAEPSQDEVGSERGRSTERPQRHRRSIGRPTRRPRQTWVALPGPQGAYGSPLEVSPRGLTLGQSVTVRDGRITFSGPRSAPLILPLNAVSKVVVVERMNVGRGTGMVVIFCGPDGRAIRTLHQGRWDASDLLRLAQAVVPEPMFYPGRHKPRHIEAQHPGTLSFGARNFTTITGAVLAMVVMTPVVVIGGLIWVLTLIF